MSRLLILLLVWMVALAAMPAHAANNSLETATPVTLGTPVTDSLDENYRPSYFKVTLPQDGKVTLTFQHQNLNDGYAYWNVTLLDSVGVAQIMNFPVAGNGADLVYDAGLPAGSYYVMVSLHSSFSSTPYTLTVGFTPGTGYEKETNDSQATATAVTLDTPYTGVLQRRYSTPDNDWYRFETPSDGVVSLAFGQNIQAPYYWRVSIVDATGTVVYLQSDITGAPAQSVHRIGLVAGTYWLSVVPYYPYGLDEFEALASSPYTLNLEFMAGSRFEKELNDTVATATYADVNETFFGFMQDKGSSDLDLYEFTVASPGTLSVDFTGPAQWVQIYDSTGTVNLFTKFTGTDMLQVPFTSSGSYLFAVSGTPGSSHSFRIEYPDSTLPQVSKTTPVSNSTDVFRNGSLVVEFSEMIDPASVSGNSVTLDKGVKGTVTVQGNSITFTPTATLSRATTYKATVSGSVKDLAGNALGADYSWSFSTVSENGSAKTPRTGQVTCSDAGGAAIACGGTGQDGDNQAGVPWPNPRFAANGNGTVTDLLTGLVWAENANLMASRNPSFDTDWTPGDGVVSWDQALAYIRKLNAEKYLGYGDWRLPNLHEMESLQNLAQQDSKAWLGAGGFQNVRTFYWSSSPKRATLDETVNLGWIWLVDLGAGRNFALGSDPGSVSPAVWPVRGGGGGAIKLAATGVVSCITEDGAEISCSGTGQDGELRKGEAPPAQRFSIKADEVTDLLTGLVWAKDANLVTHRDPSFDADGDGKVTWQRALDYLKKLNSEKYLGYGDWRLPNVRELTSLIDLGVYDNTAKLPMTGFPTSSYYWTSASFGTQVDVVGFWEGQVIKGTKGGTDYLLPVRGGASGAVSSTPATLDFGTQNSGATSAVQTLVISNNTAASLQLGSITMTGADAAMFAVAAGGIKPCGAAVSPGDFCTVEVTFSPTSGGARNAAVAIHKTGSTIPVLSVPVAGSGIKVNALLSATVSGSGGGSVNSTPSGLACTSGICTASFPIGTTVNLFATPDGNSVFTGWTGNCSGNAGCILVMGDDRSTTGTFTHVAPLRIVDSMARYFSTIRLAYDYIPSAGKETIQARKVELVGNIVLDRDVAVKVKGGYDTSYALNKEFTALKGRLIVRRGKLIAEKLVVR
ncbi:MAG: hypothetical protein A2075_21850 [Geobacteraceae bacterium GWC2_58_44]|nr:MAG: hypothetical protein A2075_21850 [Geobacteraceae bacterium GWC2_58_44]HBG06395.1 hypothetical protein [Geobacter sp.]